MHTSTDRILTTHAGSIPRGEPLGQMLIDEEAGKPVDNGALESNIGLRVSHVLEKQVAADIDIINDGEQGRVGFQGARPNHVGVAIARHKWAGRIEERDGRLYAAQSEGMEQRAAV